MSERLESLIVRLAMSKAGLAGRLRYFLLGGFFYPLLRREEHLKSVQAREASEASAAGDDVYPLF